MYGRAMSYYEFLVTIHVLAAITWIGSELYTHFQGARATARGPQAEADFVADFIRWGNTAMPVVAILLIITGVLAVLDGPWEFSQAWVSIALTAFVLLFLLGVGYYGPAGKRLAAQIEADGGTFTERSAPILRQIMLVSRIELVVLVIVVAVMVSKPGL